MRSVLTGAALGALSLAVATAAFPAGKGSTAPSASGQSTMTHPSQSTMTTSPTQKSTTTSSTTQRGPATTGQPSQNCQSLGNTPGSAASAPGSAFNQSGTAGGVYAGNQPQSSGNTASVSQYDVACARPSK